MRYLDPTISNYTKAITAGVDAQRAYAVQLDFDQQHGERAERLATIAMLWACVENGDMELDELPQWARYEPWAPATAPAPETRVYSSHVERKLTRKRARVAEQQEQERERAERWRSSGVKDALGQLAEAWGARVRDHIAPIIR
jgi:hypothetical protein